VGYYGNKGMVFMPGEAYLMNISSDIGGIDLELIEKSPSAVK